MTTETIDPAALAACPFALAAIAYLERNDFTDISQIGLRLLCAKDGKRNVFVWISVATPLESHGGTYAVAVPTKLFKAAALVKGRVDVIRVQPAVPSGALVMKHLWNVGEE